MADIRTIKIFLASSEELADERIRFGDFIRTLDDTYEQRGFRIKLIKWEDLPKGNDGRPTQETYNEHVRQCDLFVSLFYTKAGQFTIEEYNVARQTQRECDKPIIYVFLRVLDKGEQEDKSLADFKQNVLGTVKHYWTNYENSDALQLKFVMDLLKVENKRLEDLKVENGIVNWGNIPVARMDNLSFAAGNKEYQRMSQRLQELPEEIADARQLSDDHPEVGRYRDKLQKLLDEQNALKKELADQQTLLLDTAIRIAQAQGEEITDNMRRATKAFEAGDVAKANEILDQAERQGDRMYEEYLNNKSLQQWRQSLHKTIDELLQQTSMVMADVTVPIEQRIQKTHDLYRKADERAANTLYDKEKYAKLLLDYADFLYKYGKYKESERIYLRQIDLSEELYGNENTDTATSYNNIGNVYYRHGDYSKALEYYFKALEIFEKVLGKEHPNTALLYSNVGLVYYNQGDYAKALEYYFKALEIQEKVLGKEHPNTAMSYNNLGNVFDRLGHYSMSLKFYCKALEIHEKVLGKEHPYTATLYNNIGAIYDRQGIHAKALEYCFKALEIKEKVLGKEHPSTATSYYCLAKSLFYMEDYQKSLEYLIMALHIRESKLGANHPNTLSTKKSIDIVKAKLGEK